MARERFHVDGLYPDDDKNVVTSGGSGFGLMAILVGIERGFITRDEAVARCTRILNFLKKADTFHGAWSHWIFDVTGKTKPFSTKDNGADIVETAYLMQGLLTVRQYFITRSENEKLLASEIDKLWREVEWSWAPHSKYGYLLTLKHNGAEEYGGPLFWAHYSYLGLDPRNLKDKYADYWQENRNQTLINWKWCSLNTKKFAGYSEDCWGLTASYSIKGYAPHGPGETNDLGVISPTAALSSFPYTPEQ